MHRPLILIVDDESKIRRLLAQNLELEGFDVQTASDGAQALEVYNKSVEKPDLILLDLMMPEIDGMSMLKRLRKSSDVPVIILFSERRTSHGHRGLPRRSRRLRLEAFLH